MKKTTGRESLGGRILLISSFMLTSIRLSCTFLWLAGAGLSLFCFLFSLRRRRVLAVAWDAPGRTTPTLRMMPRQEINPDTQEEIMPQHTGGAPAAVVESPGHQSGGSDASKNPPARALPNHMSLPPPGAPPGALRWTVGGVPVPVQPGLWDDKNSNPALNAHIAAHNSYVAAMYTYEHYLTSKAILEGLKRPRLARDQDNTDGEQPRQREGVIRMEETEEVLPNTHLLRSMLASTGTTGAFAGSSGVSPGPSGVSPGPCGVSPGPSGVSPGARGGKASVGGGAGGAGPVGGGVAGAGGEGAVAGEVAPGKTSSAPALLAFKNRPMRRVRTAKLALGAAMAARMLRPATAGESFDTKDEADKLVQSLVQRRFSLTAEQTMFELKQVYCPAASDAVAACMVGETPQ